ncbi:gluconokinase [Nesterenkonia ebinurensis]|uniref:gluconokinase n=1 Tax=Nesterenkonia ebinurensis TaxID=2608252 RepID=UPI00123D66A4|nr:gluconokinase [Nesterenkonia ebinurensis]
MTNPTPHPIRVAGRPPGTPSRHIVVMGVSGTGKTTLAEGLSQQLGLPYAEADEFHPPENIAKMSAGTPLTDEDRWPWLGALRDWMTSRADTGSIITCSALKRPYRDLLRTADGEVLFLHVDVDRPRLEDRLTHRSGHFMPPSLLDSQLSALEFLQPDEPGIRIINDSTPEQLVDAAVGWLNTHLRERTTP